MNELNTIRNYLTYLDGLVEGIDEGKFGTGPARLEAADMFMSMYVEYSKHIKSCIADLEEENKELRERIDYLEEERLKQEQEIFDLTCGFDPKVKTPDSGELVLVQLAPSTVVKKFGVARTLEHTFPIARIEAAYWSSQGWTVDGYGLYATEFIERWWKQQTWDLEEEDEE